MTQELGRPTPSPRTSACPQGSTEGIYRKEQRLENLEDARDDEKRHNRVEKIGELGALAGGAVALVG